MFVVERHFMGCITSRDKWPPEPNKRVIIRHKKKLVLEGGRWVSKVVAVEDYTIDWPSLRCSGSSHTGCDDTSVLQSNAIRHMEGD